ncbi:hypothetical protein N7535_001519 [Penicillium sp. DV-2018c]|nr:hypothetical protein N7461_005236 [Penicillium sp. DV-2018c]KAJ5582899.1 hypothetical protein N7535_001519 [Penicillium sp. DV-2018c]
MSTAWKETPNCTQLGILDELSRYERMISRLERRISRLDRRITALSSSINQLSRGLDKTILTYLCVCCREHYLQSEISKMKCSHFYCKVCLVNMFTAALYDESSFPPRCCRKPIKISESMIGPALAKQVREKSVELNDPDRTYCFDPSCSTYIPRKPRLYATCKCPSCGKRTCRKCKKRGHTGKCEFECDALLERLAKRKGWQRCPKCSRLIELRTGCFHITFISVIVAREGGRHAGVTRPRRIICTNELIDG